MCWQNLWWFQIRSSAPVYVQIVKENRASSVEDRSCWIGTVVDWIALERRAAFYFWKKNWWQWIMCCQPWMWICTHCPRLMPSLLHYSLHINPFDSFQHFHLHIYICTSGRYRIYFSGLTSVCTWWVRGGNSCVRTLSVLVATLTRILSSFTLVSRYPLSLSLSLCLSLSLYQF